MSAPVTLYLDTTTSRLMMGLGCDGELFIQRQIECDSHRYHSALIVPAIQDLLREAGVSVRDLGALGVNHGPGSFTGIRTGIITVRTMAQFLDVPVQCFNRFDLLAFGHDRSVHIYLDALRGRAYHAVLQLTAAGPVYSQAPTLRTLADDVVSAPDEANLLISPALAALLPPTARLIADDQFTPGTMAALAAAHPDRWTRPWRDVTPLYLQEPSITLKPKPAEKV
jgi:tRNA threonylcarbamoyl adenosine modification protein YeaZ